MDDTNENVINDVLAPPPAADTVLPQPPPPAAEVTAAAEETMHIHGDMEVPELTVSQRRSFAAQGRPRQAAATAICARILGRSQRVAQRANLPPGAVENLLGFEAGLGAVWQAVWPLVIYGLLRFRQSGAAIAALIVGLDRAAQSNKRMAIALGQSTKVQVTQAQSSQAKQTRTKKRVAKAATVLSQQKQGLSAKRAADTLVSDLTAGTARKKLQAQGTDATAAPAKNQRKPSTPRNKPKTPAPRPAKPAHKPAKRKRKPKKPTQ